jgi:GNAT superfamily N-acetyltransferase
MDAAAPPQAAAEAARKTRLDVLQAPPLPDGYALECFVSPAPEPASFADDALALLASPTGEFGAAFADTWGKDLRQRAALPGSVFAVVRHGGELVAHCMVAYDPGATPSVGLVGHVFTAAAHRRKGLSSAVLKAALARHEQEGGRHWLLGTGSPSAAASYQKLGFAHLNGGLDAGTKGYNESDLGEWMMVRSSDGRGGSGGVGAHLSLYGGETGQQFRVEPLGRQHWAAAVLLLNAFEHYSAPRGEELRAEGEIHAPAAPTEDKLPTSGLGSGLVAEEIFLRDILASDEEGGTSRFRVLVNASNGQLHGVAIGNEKYHCATMLSNEGRGPVRTTQRRCFGASF